MRGNGRAPQLSELCHRAAHVHDIAAEAVELGDHQHVTGLETVEKTRKAAALRSSDVSETVSETTRRGSTLKPAAASSCSWLSVVWPVVETRR